MATLVDRTEMPASGRFVRKKPSIGTVILAIGLALYIVPTMIFVIRESWSGEAGAHGPIVLATGLWLLHRQWDEARHLPERPNTRLVWASLAVIVPLFIFARITQIVEIEGYVMYTTLLVVLYSLIGARAIKALWFPLFYLAFIFPPPETFVAAATVPMKMWLSNAAVGFLQLFGYPIGGEGVRIYIGQYELLVAAACSGINSIISLAAISLFYIYMRHQAEWRYALLLVLFIIPVALIANFFRVLILILLTYHAGEAAAQGFLHNFAGLVMFGIALLTIFGIDIVLKPIWDRAMRNKAGGVNV
ncbi:exosortase V [Sphingopyxis sp. H050]|uniref:exosortase V n=1 Tax=Sphingopyxis sp. H050 TaxID=1759072 RepID=UPI0009E7842E|nr:exosortase V [Sphingopyxis sp. H050]